MINKNQSIYLKLVLPAYELGYSPVMLERQARINWSCLQPETVFDRATFPADLEHDIHLIVDKSEYIVNCIPERVRDQRKRELKDAADRVWEEFRQAWLERENLCAILRKKEETFDDYESEGTASFEKIAWRCLHEKAVQFHETLPPPIATCSNLGAHVAASLWCFLDPARTLRLPPPIKQQPMGEMVRLLSAVAAHFPLLKSIEEGFLRRYSTETPDYAWPPGVGNSYEHQNWIAHATKNLHVEIRRILGSASTSSEEDDLTWITAKEASELAKRFNIVMELSTLSKHANSTLPPFRSRKARNARGEVLENRREVELGSYYSFLKNLAAANANDDEPSERKRRDIENRKEVERERRQQNSKIE